MFDFDDESENFNPFHAQKELITLPQLTESQCFLCDQCGSGNAVKPLHHRNVYQLIINNQTGIYTENFVMIYVSPCCKANIAVWDESVEDYIDIDPAHYANTILDKE